MNHIPVNQNSEPQLERLAAQRELYNAAKKLHFIQIIFTVLIPITLATIAFFIPAFSIVTAIFGIFSFVTDIWWVEPEISKKKNKAAKIQEVFDCELLELAKSPLKVVDDITIEEVLQHYNAHIKIVSNIEKIRNWYSPMIGVLPLHIARIVCQRTNCWWDSKLRRNYSQTLRYATIIIFGVVILASLVGELLLVNVTLIISGLMPFFRFSIKQSNDNLDASKRLDQLVQFSTSLWKRALAGESAESLSADSRRLQDEIYEHRKRSPLILNVYFNLFKDSDELLMNKSSSALVTEAMKHLDITNTD